MKRIALLTVGLAAAVGVVYATYTEEFTQYMSLAGAALQRMWANIEANPLPVFIAAGTFMLTVVYHKARGKPLRECVEVAATRVRVVPAGQKETAGDDNPVVRRAKARATRTQLMADQIGLQTRYRKLPDEVLKAEKDACYTEQALAEAERVVADKQKAHDAALAKLETLQKEKAAADAELREIEGELKKLADVV
jgi:hypothetical protein